MGERAGNANLVEVALALEALYGVATNLRLDRAREVSARVRELVGYPARALEAGSSARTLFTRESGAVASQFHDPPAIEPYSSALVGAERRIVLGKKSGLDSIRIKCEELGLDVSDRSGAPELLAAVKRRGTEQRGLVSDDAGSTRSRRARSSRRPAGVSACSSATITSAVPSRPPS